MHNYFGFLTLAISASVASAQASNASRSASAPASITSGSASARQATDSLRLSRRQAIAEALTRNAQLEIAREQTAQARARRVTAIAIPDPTLSAAYDQEAGPLGFRGRARGRSSSGSPFPSRQVPPQQPDRSGGHRCERVELSSAAADGRVAGVGRVRLTARRAEHRGILRQTRDLAADFSSAPKPALKPAARRGWTSFRRESSVAQSENDLIANERDIANAQASLNRTLGRVIGAPIAPVDSLDMPPRCRIPRPSIRSRWRTAPSFRSSRTSS